jgi:hypothetical protein
MQDQHVHLRGAQQDSSQDSSTSIVKKNVCVHEQRVKCLTQCLCFSKFWAVRVKHVEIRNEICFCISRIC